MVTSSIGLGGHHRVSSCSPRHALLCNLTVPTQKNGKKPFPRRGADDTENLLGPELLTKSSTARLYTLNLKETEIGETESKTKQDKDSCIGSRYLALLCTRLRRL